MTNLKTALTLVVLTSGLAVFCQHGNAVKPGADSAAASAMTLTTPPAPFVNAGNVAKAGATVKAPDHKYAGIDFEAVEALQMPDFKSCRNLVRNPSFEQGLKDYRLNNSYTGWKTGKEFWALDPYREDGQVAKFGQSSLKIVTYAKKRNVDYRGLKSPGNITSLPIPVSPGPYTFSFYAKGDRPGQQEISVWLPASAIGGGNIHLAIPEAKGIFKVTGDWERHSLSFKVPVSMPLNFNINAVSETGDGNVWIDGIQLEKGSKATAFETRSVEGRLCTADPGNFLQPGDKFDATLRIFTQPNASGTAKVTVTDFFGGKLFEDSFSFTGNQDGRAEIKLPFDGKFPSGIHVVKAEYELSNGKKTHDFFRLAIMEFLENKHRLKNMFADQYGYWCTSPNFLKILDRYRKIGIGAKNHLHALAKEVTDAYEKYGIEPTDTPMTIPHRGEDGRQYYKIVEGSRNLDEGETLIMDFRFENPKGELTEEYLERFGKVVAQVAAKYPWVRMWSLGGEMDAKYPELAGPLATDEEFAKYVRLEIAFFKAVKKGNPKALVFNNHPTNMRSGKMGGIQYIDRLLTGTAGQIKYDYIGVHTYQFSPENPDIEAGAQEFLAMLKKHGYTDTPVIWPEGMHWGPYNIPQWGITSSSWGPPKCWYYGALSYDMGWTEKIAAAWRARTWLVTLKHQDRIKSAMSGSQTNTFDMDVNLTPLAPQMIANTLGHLLGDAQFKEDLKFASYTRCYIFADALQRPVAAVWCFRAEVDEGKLEAPLAEADFGDQPVEIFDLMGAPRVPAEKQNGKIKFPVSSFPLFFRGKPGTLDAFVKTFRNANLVSGEGMAPVKMTANPVSATEVLVAVQNLVSKDFSGEIIVNKESKPIVIPPSARTETLFPLPAKLVADRIIKEKVEVTLKLGASNFSDNLDFAGFLCREVGSDLKIDGDLDDWKNIPAITFENRMWWEKDMTGIEDRDLSGWFKIAWNRDGIYLGAKITDNQFTHLEDPRTAFRFNNDSLQIYFDSFCDARQRETHGHDDNDYSYAVFPNAAGNSAITFRYLTPDPQLGLATEAPKDWTVATEIPAAFKKTADGYLYEVMVPAKYLLPINLQAGSLVGFGLLVNDRDDADRRKSILTLTPQGTECYERPHLWPAMLLIK